MSTILDENTSELPESQAELTGATKRVMGTFIELINVWGIQVILHSYFDFSNVTSVLIALTIIWLIKVFTEKYGKPSIGRMATASFVLNDIGKIPSWKEVILRNIVWTMVVLFFWSAYIANILYPNFPIESGDIWTWLTIYLSEKLMLYIAVLIFLADRISIFFHPKNKSLQDILGQTVVVQKTNIGF
jgi:uncharacterized RDD family membrane protein YckC